MLPAQCMSTMWNKPAEFHHVFVAAQVAAGVDLVAVGVQGVGRARAGANLGRFFSKLSVDDADVLWIFMVSFWWWFLRFCWPLDDHDYFGHDGYDSFDAYDDFDD